MSKTPPKTYAPGAMSFTPRFAYGDQAQVAVVCGPEDGTQLGAGYVRMQNAEIPWTIKYDEVVLVVEGSLTIRTPAGDQAAGAGETIWLPKGTELTYISESALLFYAIHPANWAQSAQEAGA
ncbi:MAG: ethanolamine utilization protein EutQ [Pseudomonadota bacterium]